MNSTDNEDDFDDRFSPENPRSNARVDRWRFLQCESVYALRMTADEVDDCSSVPSLVESECLRFRLLGKNAPSSRYPDV